MSGNGEKVQLKQNRYIKHKWIFISNQSPLFMSITKHFEATRVSTFPNNLEFVFMMVNRLMALD